METAITTKQGRGGKREGSGRPKGAVDPVTAKRLKSEKKFKARVYRDSDELYLAQKKLALGFNIVIKKTFDPKSGKWSKAEIVTNPKEILRFLNGKAKKNVEYFDIVTSKPDNSALEGLLNRAYGKPKESIELDHTNEPITSVSIKIIKSKDELRNRRDNSTTENN